MLASLIGLLTGAVVYGTVMMYGALGEIITEKAGHLNLGVPGLMFLGGFAAFASSYLYETNVENPSKFILLILPFVAAVLLSGLGGLLYGFLTITLKANQNVTGLALTSFGVGLGTFGGVYICKASGNTSYAKAPLAGEVYSANLNSALGLGSVGKLFLSYGFLVYFAILLAIAVHYFLTKTRYGLSLNAVGENPATADAAGIDVTKYKYLSTIIGAAICGLGGLCYVLEYGGGNWSTSNNIEALGWLAVALVIFSTWKAVNVIWGSYLFAACYWLYIYIAGILNVRLNQQTTDLLQMLPYVVTILVLIAISVRKKRENQPPASLGLSYFREER